jgi:hypothetical protein
MKKNAIIMIAIMILSGLISCELPSIEWIDATEFVNGWVSAPGAYQPVQYGKDEWGQVHIRGTAFDVTPASTSNVFTLPADYLPTYQTSFPITIYSGGTPYCGNMYLYPEGTNSNQVNVYYAGGTIQYAYFGEIIYTPAD